MQSLNWYIQRLKSMSPSEIAWRLQSEIRDVTDRIRVPMGLFPSPEIDLSDKSGLPGFRVSDVPEFVEKEEHIVSGMNEEWLGALVVKADLILDNKLSYFDLKEKWHGEPFNWNKDFSSNKQAQMSIASAVNYRDFEKNGDCKLIWEPNRCHHLVVLGRAYRVAGDTRYAEAVVDLIDSWLDSNPVGKGMNWRSPMELSIRLINWVWAIDLIRDTGFFTGTFKKRVLQSVYLHLWDVQRKFSKGSSANNHVIGEAAGVYIAISYFTEIKGLGDWRQECVEILEKEVLKQTFSDGCNKELALGYHLFVLQFFILSGVAGERSGKPFSKDYWIIIEKKLQFLGQLTDGGGGLQMYGDCDDGYVLDLGSQPDDPFGLLCMGAVLFGRTDLKKWTQKFREPAWWLFGKSGLERFQEIAFREEENLQSLAFRDAGLYLLQYGKSGNSDRISVLFDCGLLGYKSIAAHGHADALSFTLKAFGEDIFVDPGTYDYFTLPRWRKYFRSTSAHNTIVVDGQDQSVMVGPFMWSERANCTNIKWQPTDDGGIVCGEHDGYGRLNDPVIHRRTLELNGKDGRLDIVDKMLSAAHHKMIIYFHLAEQCRVEDIGGNCYSIVTDKGELTLELDKSFKVQILFGSDKDVLGGWVSQGYHRKVASFTIVGSCSFNGVSTVRSKVTIR